MTTHPVSTSLQSAPHDHAWRPVGGAAHLFDEPFAEYWCPLCGLVWPVEDASSGLMHSNDAATSSSA